MFSAYIFGVFLVLAVVPPLYSKPLYPGNTTYDSDYVLNNTIRRTRESDFVFPESDDDEPVMALPKLMGPPPCARGTTFCENFVSYPGEQLKGILERHRVNKEFFGVDAPPEELGTRDDSEDTFVCPSEKTVIFPEVAMDQRGGWKFIINQKEEGYIQGLQVEICKRHGRSCKAVQVPNDFTTECKQKYNYRRLLALNDKMVPTKDIFLLPSTCACAYKRNFFLVPGFTDRRD